MTDALCLNCGDIKFGALCPCPSCKCGPQTTTRLTFFSAITNSREAFSRISAR